MAAPEAGVCLGVPTWAGPMGDQGQEEIKQQNIYRSRAGAAGKKTLEKVEA